MNIRFLVRLRYGFCAPYLQLQGSQFTLGCPENLYGPATKKCHTPFRSFHHEIHIFTHDDVFEICHKSVQFNFFFGLVRNGFLFICEVGYVTVLFANLMIFYSLKIKIYGVSFSDWRTILLFFDQNKLELFNFWRYLRIKFIFKCCLKSSERIASKFNMHIHLVSVHRFIRELRLKDGRVICSLFSRRFCRRRPPRTTRVDFVIVFRCAFSVT